MDPFNQERRELNIPQKKNGRPGEEEFVDLHKIQEKLKKVFKSMKEGLQPPVFQSDTANKIRSILENLEILVSRYDNEEPRNSKFIKIFSKYITELDEMTSQNMLQPAISELQAGLNVIRKDGTKLWETICKIPNHKSILSQYLHQLDNLMAKVFTISNHNSPINYLPSVKSNLRQIASDVQAIVGKYQSTIGTQEEILSFCHRYQNLCVSILHSHTLIYNIESLQNIYRRMTFKGYDIKVLQLPNSVIHLKPHKPKPVKAIEINDSVPSVNGIKSPTQQVFQNLKNLDELLTELPIALKKEFSFKRITNLISELLYSIIHIRDWLPEGTDYKITGPLAFVTNSFMTKLHFVPSKISSIREVKEIISSARTVFATFESILEKVLPEKQKDVLHTKIILKTFIKEFDSLEICAEFLSKANDYFDEPQIYFDISAFVFPVVPKRFAYVMYLNNNPKARHMSILRSFNKISKYLRYLERCSICFQKDYQGGTLKPISIAGIVQKIHNNFTEIEVQLYSFSLNQYKEFPVSKSGITLLSVFAEYQRKTEECLLNYISIPNIIMTLRSTSIILYNNMFTASKENNFINLMDLYYIIFRVCQVYEKLENIGTVSFQSACQLSFIATICDRLVQKGNRVFEPYRNYFCNVNLFNINNEEILKKAKLLMEEGHRYLKTFSIDEFNAQFIQNQKTANFCQTILKKATTNVSINKLLGHYTSWISNLPRTYPKSSNLREMQIRMTVLRRMVDELFKDNPKIRTNTAFPYEDWVEAISIFDKLREAFASKSLVKRLLNFLERINYSDPTANLNTETDITDKKKGKKPIPKEYKEPTDHANESETLNIDPGAELSVSNTELSEFYPKKQSPIASEDEELFTQISFDSYYPIDFLKNSTIMGNSQKFINRNKPEVEEKTDYYTVLNPHLIINHCGLVTDRYMFEFTSNQKLQQDINTLLSPIAQLRKESMEEIKIKLNSNIPEFTSFTERIEAEIQDHIEQMINFLITSNSRFKNGHVPIEKLIKKFTAIKSEISDDFEWFGRTLELIPRTLDILPNLTSVDIENLLDCHFSLWRKGYLWFLVDRLFNSITDGQGSFNPDIYQINEDFEILMKQDNVILGHEISTLKDGLKNVLESDFQFGFDNIENILIMFGANYDVINFNNMMNNFNNPFFDFYAFFFENTQIRNHTSLLNSPIFAVADKVYQSLFSLLIYGFTDVQYIDCIKLLTQLNFEFNNAPFQIDHSGVSNKIETINSFAALMNLAISFDTIHTFLTHQDFDKSTTLLMSYDVIHAQLLFFALHDRFCMIYNSGANFFDRIMPKLNQVISSFMAIKRRFGLIIVQSELFNKFRKDWIAFTKDYKPVKLAKYYYRIKKYASIIINDLTGNSADLKDEINEAKILVNQFILLHDIKLLYRTRLTFQYIQSQIDQIGQNCKNDLPPLPFQELYDAINILEWFDQSRLIIIKLTHVLNHMFTEPCPSIPEFFYIIRKKDNKNDPEFAYLEQQLNFNDQIILGFLVGSTADANQKDKETLYQIPVLSHELEQYQPKIASLERTNSYYSRLNQVLEEYVYSLVSIKNDVSKKKATEEDQNDIIELIEKNELMYQCKKKELMFNACEESYQLIKQVLEKLSKEVIDLSSELEKRTKELSLKKDKYILERSTTLLTGLRKSRQTTSALLEVVSSFTDFKSRPHDSEMQSEESTINSKITIDNDALLSRIHSLELMNMDLEEKYNCLNLKLKNTQTTQESQELAEILDEKTRILNDIKGFKDIEREILNQTE